jgi:glycosyltransferase involved in cell wall biosynthesis
VTQQDEIERPAAPAGPRRHAPAAGETERAAPAAGRTRRHVLVVVENIALCDDQRVRKQVPTLLAAGHHVSVITRRDPGNAAWRDTPGLTVLEHPPPPEPASAAGYLLEYAHALACAAVLAVAAHRRRRVDVLHLCQPPDLYFPLAWLMRWWGAAVVVDQRDLMPELFRARYGERPAMARVLAWLERRTQRAADHAIGVNRHLELRLRGAGARAVSVVRNGPRRDRVAAARPDPALRAGAAHLCVWVGKMGRQDRVDLLVEAVGHLVHVRGRRDCRVVLLGDGECLDELRARVTALGLDPWVTFTGWLSEPDLFTYLASADVGLDTSLQVEVSPVKVMEYMAFGLPVMAFDLPETTALALGAGVTVAPGDVVGFADALDALLDDPARGRALGAEGARRVAGELCWERQAGVYLSVIDQLVARPGRRRRAPIHHRVSPGTE